MRVGGEVLGAAPRWRPLALAMVVGLAGFAAYSSSFHGAFVLDDVGTIVRNLRIRTLEPALLAGRRPVVTATLAVNHALGGLDVRGYHAVNLAVHLLAGLALFGVVRRTMLTAASLERRRPGADWIAFAAALIWVVHPLTTQAVTYLIQRSESMMGLFYLLTLYTAIRGAGASGGRRWLWHAASVAACALGMGSKAVMITAPFLVLLHDRTFGGESFARALRARWGLYLALALTFAVLLAGGILRIFDPGSGGNVGFGYRGVTWLEYARTQPEVILHYLALAFWPRALCLDYGWPVAENASDIVAAGAAVAILAGASAWALVRRRWYGFAGCAFFIVLAPTSSVIPIRDLAFEHRMYLPLAAVVVLAVGTVFGLGAALVRARSSGREEVGRRRALVRAGGLALLALVAAALAARTARRNHDYDDPVGMWASVVAARPGNERPLQNLGSALLEAGRLDEALAANRAVLKMNPAAEFAHVNLGTIHLARGELDQAARHYRAALAVNPRSTFALNNLGAVLARQGRLDKAEVRFADAVRLRPRYADAWFNLGLARAALGRIDEAADAFEEVLRLDPGHERARRKLAELRRRLGPGH